MMRYSTSSILLTIALAYGQQVGENKTGNDTPNFTVTRQLKIETVLVKDKSGNPVEGLTAKDFNLTEDGVAQEIKFFEYQRLEEIIKDTEPLPPIGAPKYYQKLPHTQIAGEVPGKTSYKDRRLLVLYFDMTAMPPQDQLRALDAAQKFIKKQMTAVDLMSIIQYAGGAVQVLRISPTIAKNCWVSCKR